MRIKVYRSDGWWNVDCYSGSTLITTIRRVRPAGTNKRKEVLKTIKRNRNKLEVMT